MRIERKQPRPFQFFSVTQMVSQHDVSLMLQRSQVSSRKRTMSMETHCCHRHYFCWICFGKSVVLRTTSFPVVGDACSIGSVASVATSASSDSAATSGSSDSVATYNFESGAFKQVQVVRSWDTRVAVDCQVGYFRCAWVTRFGAHNCFFSENDVLLILFDVIKDRKVTLWFSRVENKYNRRCLSTIDGRREHHN